MSKFGYGKIILQFFPKTFFSCDQKYTQIIENLYIDKLSNTDWECIMYSTTIGKDVVESSDILKTRGVCLMK